MVYRGKPSAACELCRRTRRKCDQARPSCGQCVRASVICSGYRDVSGLAIYNETEDTIRRVKVSSASSRSPSASSDVLTSSPTSSAAPLQVALPTSVYNTAISYFVLAYAPSGQFSYLPNLISSDTLNQATIIPETARGIAEATLPLALLSCSLATLSLTPSYPPHTILPIAYKTYSTAIASLNAALATPATSARDGTLLSVLLLGLFEAVLFRGRQSPTSWTAHTHGALALLKLRGAEQFKTDLGRRLFVHAANNIRASCSQRAMLPPEELTQLQEQAYADGQLDPRSDFGARVGLVMEKTIKLRADITRLGDFSAPTSRRAVAKLLELDDEATGVVRDTMSHNRKALETFDPTPTPGEPSQGPGSSSAYQRLAAARSMMVLHTLRLNFNKWVYQCLSESERCFCGGEGYKTGTCGMDHLECLTETQERAALRLAISHATDAVTAILNAVPWFTGSPSATDRPPFCRYLILPLSTVAMSQFATREERAVALGHLHDIGRHFGLEQAEEAARMAEDAGELEDWAHVHILS